MANKPNNKVAKDVKKNSKDKRHFMKDFKAELKRVIWPTPKELLSSTVAVITIVVIVTAIVFVLDLGFKALNDQGINRLRTVITNETTAEEAKDPSEVPDETPTNNEENANNETGEATTDNGTEQNVIENPETQENTNNVNE